MTDIHGMLRGLIGGASLPETDAEALFEAILSGSVDDAQIGAVLTAIAVRSPTVDELVAGARVMRRHVTAVTVPAALRARSSLIDTCGTGGAPKMFNVSTAAAIVTAAAGSGEVLVAKHGSRSRTGRGSAEVLEQLGVNVGAAPAVQTRCLEETGVCFSFAIHHHPAMKHAAGPRKSLGFPTIFNLLGPLTNPAGATRQLIGTYDRGLSLKIAETLARIGTDRAVVATSHDGLDELTTTNTNLTHTVEGGRIVTRVLDAERLGFARARFDDLRVETLDAAAEMVLSTVRGDAGPATDVVVLNAGAALFVAGVAESIEAGVKRARQTVSDGAAVATLERLRMLSHG